MVDIRNVLTGALIRTRPIRGEPDVYELKVLDNYWNRRSRVCRDVNTNATCVVPTIDIAEVWVSERTAWEPVVLTPAQRKRLNQQVHLEYVTSPESETYWCS